MSASPMNIFSSKGDGTGAGNKRKRSLMEALSIVDEDGQPLREWSEKTGESVESEPTKNADDTPHREYLKKVFAELRQEGLRELEDGDTIFEVKGREPQTRLFRRFGSSLDRLMYSVCRFIATWDIICVLPLLCYGDILRMGIVRRFFFLRVFEISMVALYFYGVFLRFFTSIVDVDCGAEYVELGEIFSRHVTSWTLWADVVSLVGNLWWVWPNYWFIAGFRLLRVWRLPSNTNHTYLITTGRTESPTGTLLELVLALWIVAHVFGCIWFYADTMQMEDEAQQLEAHQAKNVVYESVDEVAEEMLDSFIRNTGFAYLEYMKDGAAMLVGWNGPEPQAAVLWTSPEMLFWIVVAPVAAMYMTALYAWLMMIVDRMGANENRHRETVEKLGIILHTLKVPDTLKKRVLQYHSFLSLHNIDTSAYDVLFTGLSSNLHVETKLFLFENLLLTASFFDDVPAMYLTQLVSSLLEDVFSPGDMIVHKGQVGEELFFIIKGSAEVLLDDDATEVVAVKHVGEYFGEIALVLDQVRTAWIRAKTFCVLAKLLRDSLNHILENVPEVKSKMVDKIMKNCKQVIPVAAKPGSKMDKEVKAAQELEALGLGGSRERRTSRVQELEALESQAEPRAEPQAEPRVQSHGEKPRLSLTGYKCPVEPPQQSEELEKKMALAKIDNHVVDLQIGQRDITQSVKQISEAVQLLSGHLSFALYSQ